MIGPGSTTIPRTISEKCAILNRFCFSPKSFGNPSDVPQKCSIVTRELLDAGVTIHYDPAAVPEMWWRSGDGVPSQREWPDEPEPGNCVQTKCKVEVQHLRK